MRSFFKLFVVSSLVVFFFSTDVKAGSFQDFILAEEQPEVELTVHMPDKSVSSSCMQCHSGKKARSISLKHAQAKMSFSGFGNGDHPVGMNYDEYARNKPRHYVPSSRLDSRIVLENGQVTCVSCHQIKPEFNNQHANNLPLGTVESCGSTKTLTTESNQTGLCMSCHSI
ncbi:MAG: hypothetical protein OEY19_03010 [Gammaproteobacteria bacterium]|nr:hypothetical protein [Gammaproteobacteria bacterium]MDH5630164.1 hypothetical protein [Gammaproteobacteria bacterium]